MKVRLRITFELSIEDCTDLNCPWGYQPTAQQIAENLVAQWVELERRGLLDPEHKVKLLGGKVETL